MSQALSMDDLRKLQELMEAMLLEIKNSNWQALTRLDGERRAILGYHINRDAKIDKPRRVQLPRAQSGASTVIGLATANSPPAPPAQITTDKNLSYEQLSANLLEMDRQINLAVKQARLSLVEQNRGLQAQVSAKKGYEHANSVQSEAFG